MNQRLQRSWSISNGMDQEFQTSFIPKKQDAGQTLANATSSAKDKTKKTKSLYMIISIIVFVASLMSAGGVYFYKGFLESNIAEMQGSLDRAKGAFEPGLISDLQLLDTRIRAAEDILGNHVAVSPIFSLLSELTFPAVQYTSFTYSLNNDTNEVMVQMQGKATEYRWVTVQADLFNKNKNIKNPIFSNLTLDKTGRVIFDLSFSVDRAFATYGSPLNNTIANNTQ